MASKKLADRKKNRREAEKRQLALKRQATAVQDRRQRNIEFKVQKMMKPKQMPVRNAGEGEDPVFTKHLTPDEIRARLDHNLEILKALEEEYDKEMEARQGRNSDLEEDGCSTLKEKMDALHGQVVSTQMAKEGIEFGGEAEVVFTPNQENEVQG
jgi:hypothetical protein